MVWQKIKNCDKVIATKSDDMLNSLPSISTVASFRKKYFFIILAATLFFLLGIISGWLVLHISNKNEIYELRQSSFTAGNYTFIDPLLGCSIEKKDIVEFNGLKQNILKVINDKISAKQLASASVYFDTRDGRWLGINLNDKYFPASLMKVPFMIAILKVAESHPELLQKKVVYDGSFDYNKMQYFKPIKVLAPHQSYTVDELLTQLIGYSDNNAIPLLTNIINSNILDEVYTDLGVQAPQNEEITLNDYLTVKEYANLFRILYNASYLNREMSEKALKLMSLPDFPSGIMAGLPNGTKFADKFGERVIGNDLNDPKAQRELHDCAIVYPGNRQYLLCVMTRGTDFQTLAGIIKDISKATYDYINDNKE